MRFVNGNNNGALLVLNLILVQLCLCGALDQHHRVHALRHRIRRLGRPYAGILLETRHGTRAAETPGSPARPPSPEELDRQRAREALTDSANELATRVKAVNDMVAQVLKKKSVEDKAAAKKKALALAAADTVESDDDAANNKKAADLEAEEARNKYNVERDKDVFRAMQTRDNLNFGWTYAKKKNKE